MPPLTLICSHCGSEHPIATPVPGPEALLSCVVCGHEASYAQWLTKTEREFAALTLDRMKDISRQRG
jgi:hypothetical protein